MRVLYIGNQGEHTGWGDACYNNIIAMDKVGIDVVPRAIYFGSNKRECKKLKELESRDIGNYDVVIQHTLPHLYSYVGPARNIGFYETEATFESSGWNKYINLLDEAWVSCNASKIQSEISGVRIPIKKIPHCIDISKYTNIEKTARIRELDETYNFCFVGEFSKRKNVSALLKAFHLEFGPQDNVGLFLKLSRPDMGPLDCYSYFEKVNNEIIGGLKLGKRQKTPLVSTGFKHHNDLLSMISQCHCFVSPSHGEAWCYPALEAMALGLNVIYTEKTGVEEFANHPSCLAAQSKTSYCFNAVDTLPNLYTGRDFWQEINVESLMNCMRISYNSRNNIDRESIKQHAKLFSHEVVGEIIKRALC